MACTNYGVHPGLPVTVTNLTVVFCHICQGWEVTWWSATQTGEEERVIHAEGRCPFGPFDDASDVLRLLRSLQRSFVPPMTSGDRASSSTTT
jgi:hypothetical protein